MVEVHHASMLDWLAAYDGPLFDSCVTDPPYHLTQIGRTLQMSGNATAKDGVARRANVGFMGKQWDGGDIAFRPETWRAVYDALKPGAHLVAFSSTRTYHRMACAIEDAGFEIRDQLAWAYGSGFPKSHDVSKGIDKAAGALKHQSVGFNVAGMTSGLGTIQRQELRSDHPDYQPYSPATDDAAAWQGWGTALKPAWEPICLARKPLSEKTVAANVLRWGTGAINVDGCRVGTDETIKATRNYVAGGLEPGGMQKGVGQFAVYEQNPAGRWPANILHDGSDEVLAGFPETGVSSGGLTAGVGSKTGAANIAFGDRLGANAGGLGDSGSAARFFYSAKAGPLDRIGTSHATVKPVDVMRWLCRLVTPKGGHILEPFAGSGTTGIAAMAEGFDCTMIELEADHVADIERKLSFLRGEGALTFVEHNRHRQPREAGDMPLFAA